MRGLVRGSAAEGSGPRRGAARKSWKAAGAGLLAAGWLLGAASKGGDPPLPTFEDVAPRSKITYISNNDLTGRKYFPQPMCGGAQQVLDMSVEYAKVREQFGRPIGSFQAIQHKCADMLVQVESSKSATYYAAWAVAGDVPEAPLAAAMAKAYCSDAYRVVAGEGIQIHGGIGFTWEHDMHIYFKRAKSSEVSFGDATWNRELVAGHIL